MRQATLYWDAGELRLPEQVHETHTNHHIAPLVRGELNRLAHVKLERGYEQSATDVELTVRKRAHGGVELLYRPLRKER
jgi:hypothetical protein